MNYDQFGESMKRVLSFTQAPKTPSDIENLNRYMKALYEAIGTMDAYVFEKVTVEICKNMGRGQRPMPGQFWAVYSRIRGEEAASKPIEVCPSCRNTIWTLVRMLETKTGFEMDFAEPCPACQHRHPFKDAPPRVGWIRVEKKRSSHEEEMMADAKKMGAKGARFILGMIERGAVKFSDEVILELVIRAGDTPPQSNPQVEAALNGIKVEPAREAASVAAVGSSGPTMFTPDGEEYEVDDGQV